MTIITSTTSTTTSILNILQHTRQSVIFILGLRHLEQMQIDGVQCGLGLGLGLGLGVYMVVVGWRKNVQCMCATVTAIGSITTTTPGTPTTSGIVRQQSEPRPIVITSIV